MSKIDQSIPAARLFMPSLHLPTDVVRFYGLRFSIRILGQVSTGCGVSVYICYGHRTISSEEESGEIGRCPCDVRAVSAAAIRTSYGDRAEVGRRPCDVYTMSVRSSYDFTMFVQVSMAPFNRAIIVRRPYGARAIPVRCRTGLRFLRFPNSVINRFLTKM